MFLFKYIQNYKNNIALISEETGAITYNQLTKCINKIKKKIPERSLIFLISENSIASIISYIFSIKNNCVAMLVDIKTNKDEISNLINSYKPSFICASKQWMENFSDNNFKAFESLYEYSFYRTKYNISPLMHKDLSLLLPTSGSMGSPKFVRISKNNLKSNANSIIKYLNINSSQRSITNMPFNYSYMLSIINTYLESGASIYISKYSIIQKKFWEEFLKYKITSLSGVPYIFEMLVKLGLKKLPLNNLKILTHAGGKLDIDSAKIIIKFCGENKIKFFSMYGQTEASPRMTYLDWKVASKKIGSIGKAIPNTEIWLENENGEKIKNSNEIGELIFSGRNVSMGYSNNLKDLKKDDENKGVLKTGDYACFDDEGYFYIKGRKKRITKLFGNRFNLDEIEEKMKKLKFEVFCKDVNDKLYIFFDKDFDSKDVLNKVSKITGQNKIAFSCIKLKQLPRTSSGKVDYLKLNINAKL